MKTSTRNFSQIQLVVAVQAALAAMAVVPMAAHAEGDEDVAALTQPSNSVDVGLSGTQHGTDKSREYSDRRLGGLTPIAGINIRGGDGYGMNGGSNRWSVVGTDLGTHSRSLSASASDQGNWNFSINYDELRHYITDSYQTPLLGRMGGNEFYLPNSFGAVNTQTKPGAVGGVIPPYGTQALTANQQAALHTQEVHTDRKNAGFSLGKTLDEHWSMKLDYNRLMQDGAKLISAGTDVQNKGSFASVRGENILMLMNPTHYATDSATLSFNWLGDKGYFSGGYYGSFFRDANNGLSFSNPYTGTLATGVAAPKGFPIDTLSTAPDNDFQQLNFTGGYSFTPNTKVVGGFSYARNTQNMSYINGDQMVAGGLPQTSLNGLVITTHADVKLTQKASKDLNFSAGLKYNERDNRTSANTYKFYDLGGGVETAVNTPMSNKKTQLELAGDYRLNARNSTHFGYEYEQINRWCNSSLANNAQGPGPGGPSATASAYYTTASCAQVPKSDENKLFATYKLKASEDIVWSAGYTYADRKANVNSAFYNPMQANNQGYELPGYRAFFDASRTENLLKTMFNWQMSEKFGVSFTGRYAHDKYDDSAMGVQNGHLWSTNLDATYNIAEKSSFSAYVGVQERMRALRNGVWSHTTATYNDVNNIFTWANTLNDKDYSAGISFKQGGLLADKLNLAADLVYSLGRSHYTTNVNYVNAACTAPSNAGYVCGDTPPISSRQLQLTLSGDYAIDKANKLAAGLIYQRLKSSDYYYNAYQMGYTPTSLMPTNQQSPSYRSTTVYLVYSYNFQ